jgi:isoquinoline 1-oxidoreductase subunit beta
MPHNQTTDETYLAADSIGYDERIEPVEFGFGLTRRQFVQALGAGVLIAVCHGPVLGQARGGRRGEIRGGAPTTIAARLHIAQDGTITILSGKVECGQGSRAQLTQAAAEELRVPAERVRIILADTGLVPNDGITAGSRTTPATVPTVREAAAAARELLVDLAGRNWEVERTELDARDGRIIHTATGREQAYGDLAALEDVAEAFQRVVPENVIITRVSEWQVMGRSLPRPNRRDIVTGSHQYPSDIVRPGMLYGRVLRPPTYRGQLREVDLAPAQAMEGVVTVRDGSFAGIAAPTTFQAEQALQAMATSATWDEAAHPTSNELYDHLRREARDGVPQNPFRAEVEQSATALRATYHVPYVQHAPMEPRAAVAEWQNGRLTVWTATQNPFGVRGELARAFRVDESSVRVIVPDFGGGFGGKHTGESAVEAARLAQAAGRPVCLRWTREEEFTWAVFRPAAVIDVEAGLNADGRITSWHFININSGGAAINTPYAIERNQSQFVQSDPPLRHGSYRALAATANNFARECFMDELAGAAGQDPLQFRLAHLEDPRLRAVLEEAAKQFGWAEGFHRSNEANIGIGLACGTEKGSYVAACAEVAVDPQRREVHVQRVCQVFECGAIINPDNLRAQVLGCMIMGLGPALYERTGFEDGRMLNPSFSMYRVPRFEDVPEMAVHLLDRPDLPSAGGSETPIIAIAPAIANAVARATGQRVREMPLRLPRP